uniref:Uncharacterized protein n=1 Tax=Oryza glumipatula TaxID=40148 RepID=A0A0E0AY61_9ORYZ
MARSMYHSIMVSSQVSTSERWAYDLISCAVWPSDGHASCAIIESHQYPVCNLKVTRLVDGEAQPSPANTSRCPESEATDISAGSSNDAN